MRRNCHKKPTLRAWDKSHGKRIYQGCACASSDKPAPGRRDESALITFSGGNNVGFYCQAGTHKCSQPDERQIYKASFCPQEPQTVVIIVNSSVWDLNKRQKTRPWDFYRLNNQFTDARYAKTCTKSGGLNFPVLGESTILIYCEFKRAKIRCRDSCLRQQEVWTDLCHV